MSLNRIFQTVMMGVLIASVGCVASAGAHSGIDIVASNWKFTPDTITLDVGTQQTLRLTSSGGVHGLESKDLGIKLTTILPGKFVEVKVTPTKVGTYVVHCAIVCGPGHENMKLTIKVVQ